MSKISQLVRKYEVFLQDTRMYLHQIPEPRFKTKKTRNFILKQIKSFDSKFIDFEESKGGIIVDYDYYPKTEKRIALRADFDALAITEATGLPYSSNHPGLMHACGHDIHTAWLLTVLKIITDGYFIPKTNLRFFFEDGEENPTTPSGAEIFVNNRYLDDVSEIHGLHIWAESNCKTGTFYTRKDALLGNSGRLGIKLRCQGGHVAMPKKGDNALRILYKIQNAINYFVSNLPTNYKPFSFEPTTILAGKSDGKSSNIMPAELEAWWAVRTMLPRNVHEKLMELLEKKITKVAESNSVIIEFISISGHPALINNSELINTVNLKLKNANISTNLNHPQILGGESFAYYAEKVPATFWMLGAYQEGCGNHHQPTFNPDPNVFYKGVEFFLNILS